ncbi:hypothetical protein O6H91_08G069400 [Diphasiastrum complanatum]|uniref:Uncharacterized protein n=1 Tax=Diphasiastrum complanatum TaxID=34168 RepID=A0ACC2CYR1_DIPCM|nr:hypothetical protein O6H91_08G069400 [Diphasiastrum complanatum]
MATIEFSEDNAVDTVIPIFRLKPEQTHDNMLEKIISHYGNWDEAEEFIISANLRSLDHTYGASIAHFKKGTHIPTAVQLPHALEESSDIEIIEVEVIPGVSKTGEAPKLCKGDILHMGLLSTEPESQQNLVDTLQKTLIQQIQSAEGLESITVHRSRDGNKVIVIGLWTDAASAQAAAVSPGWQQADEFLGPLVKSKEFKIFEVVLVR